ncbi:MAG: diguanylate cyclase [Oscillospiraceae bacterium]
MKKNELLKGNFLVCMIIIIGFAITSAISYQSTIGIYKTDVEQVSALTSDGIYSNIGMIFAKPVSISLTMANDSLLRTFLKTESVTSLDNKYLNEMKSYLKGYHDQYGYDSVFFISSATGRYYHYNGLDRIIEKGDPENVWYYDFIVNNEDYALHVDNDQASTDDSITVFINCKLRDTDGTLLGIVGVGMQIHSLQELLSSYEKKYGVTAYLIDETGIIEISSAKTGYEQINLFDTVPYAKDKDTILSQRKLQQSFWFSSDKSDGFVVTRYEPNLKWHLIIENDTSVVTNQLNAHIFQSFVIIAIIVFLVLLTITAIIKKYNAEIVKLALIAGIRRDSITQLYNKRATEEMISDVFKNDIDKDVQHAFIMLDIDNFKTVNDTMGHKFGDHVIMELANELKAQFRDTDIVGRIGGDEFAVLVKNIESSDELLQKLGRMCKRLSDKDVGDGQVYHVSCSIGVAFYKKDGTAYSELFEKSDQALYYAKAHGKNSYAVYGENSGSFTSHISQRNMESLLNSATEGTVSFACTQPLTLLCFNEKFVKLTGVSSDVLSKDGYDPFSSIHPDDVENVKALLQQTLEKKLPFTIDFRMMNSNGEYCPLKVKGVYITELYNNEYPVFYAMYTK